MQRFSSLEFFKMLMLSLVFVVLLEFCASSPVYNMQPAFITANIGTTGRNIRNLPCISRKSNQNGVCMFAIDCLKANGTHLGTCIDRFYFGSCCHVPPIVDIVDNSIDINIIPQREPPQRISSTAKLPISTTKVPISTTKVSISTTLAPASSTTANSTRISSTTTRAPSSSTSTTTTVKQKTSTTPAPLKTTIAPSSTISYKLTTFQSVDGNHATNASIKTEKPSSTTHKYTTTSPKPSTLAIKVNSTTTTSRKPSTTTTRKPPRTSPVTKTPSTTIITKKPIVISTSSSTKKPVLTSKPTKKPTITKITTIGSTSTTITTKLTTIKPASSTTPIPVKNATVEAVLNATSLGSTTTTSRPTMALSSSSTESSSTQGSIVTWTMADERNASVSSTAAPIANSTSEEWVPVTTSDNWVPLPSVSTTTIATTSESASSVKPSITYIPLGATNTTVNTTTTTPLSLNNATSATTGASNGTLGTTTMMPPTTTTSDAEIVRPVNMSDFTDVCGRRMVPKARIVGGDKSAFGQWPWQISLRQWRTSTYLHKCGAALLNENWAITAAHCVDNVPPSDLLLRLGEHDLSTETEPYLHQERRVQIVASHPNFDPRTFEYDLALLRFYEPVTFQPNILPVCVPQVDESFVGRTAYVTGWGRLYEDGPLPSILQEVSVPVINNSVCESMYRLAGYIEHIPHIFICAGWRRGGFDSCEGDSGGPMVIQREDRRFMLAGVISWGIGCAEPNQPGVYTRISEFRDWINQILQF